MIDSIPIAITGVGVVSPIGVDEHGFWSALREGRSGIVAGEDGWLRARVGEFHPRRWIAGTALRRTPRLVQMTFVAAKQEIGRAHV